MRGQPRALTAALLALLAAGPAGCVMQNVSAEQALGDAVYELNEGARWRRAVLVASRVADAYRDRFVRRHAAWGRSLRIADMEVLETRLDEDSMDRAESTVVVRWYDQGAMLLRESTVRQRWERVGPSRRFALVGEEIVEGHPGLFGGGEDGSGGEELASERHATSF